MQGQCFSKEEKQGEYTACSRFVLRNRVGIRFASHRVTSHRLGVAIACVETGKERERERERERDRERETEKESLSFSMWMQDEKTPRADCMLARVLMVS